MVVIGRMRGIHKKILVFSFIILFVLVLYYINKDTYENFQTTDLNSIVETLKYFKGLGLNEEEYKRYNDALNSYKEFTGRDFDPENPYGVSTNGLSGSSPQETTFTVKVEGGQFPIGLPGPQGPPGPPGPPGADGYSPNYDSAFNGVYGELDEIERTLNLPNPRNIIPEEIPFDQPFDQQIDQPFDQPFDQPQDQPQPQDQQQLDQPQLDDSTIKQQQEILARSNEVAKILEAKPYILSISQDAQRIAPYLIKPIQEMDVVQNPSTVLAYYDAQIPFLNSVDKNTPPEDFIKFWRNFFISQGISIGEGEGFTNQNKNKKSYKDFTQRFNMIPTEYAPII